MGRAAYKAPVKLGALRWMFVVVLGASRGLGQEAPSDDRVQIVPMDARKLPPGPPPILSGASPKARGFALRGVGARGSVASTRSDEDLTEAFRGGGDLYERGVGVLRLDSWSGRYFDELSIGYGSEGLRYQVAGQLGFGWIGLFDEDQGVAVRFAARGHLRREGGVYSSELRVPGGELGYFWSRDTAQLEVLAHAGMTLTGRYQPEGQTRDLRGFSYGSSLSFGWARLRVDADLSQVAADADEGGVLQVSAHFCRLSHDRQGGRRSRLEAGLRPPEPTAWALCGDFRALRGSTRDVTTGLEVLGSEQVVWGISLTFGQLAHL